MAAGTALGSVEYVLTDADSVFSVRTWQTRGVGSLPPTVHDRGVAPVCDGELLVAMNSELFIFAFRPR